MVHSSPILVSPGPDKRVKGEHWADDRGRSFKNPWDSWRDFSFTQLFSFGPEMNRRSAANGARDMPRIDELVPRTTPTWGRPEDRDKMKATWMGHASYLVEMPHDPLGGTRKTESIASGAVKAEQERGVTVLFDPAWSERCSPVQFLGSKRYQAVPASISDIPEIDIICISHNHYDHQDTNTLNALYKRFSNRPPILCVGLNGGDSLPSSVPRNKIVEMDWFEGREVTVEGKGKVLVTCTPAQHMSKRGAFDTAKALWASWAIKSIPSDPAKPAHNLWFGGDTGYRATDSESHNPTENDHLPCCPAFKQIGERLGPFSLGLIPIGAYEPRWFLSNVHASPVDAVRIFQDVVSFPIQTMRYLSGEKFAEIVIKKAKTALGIHWGTWHMAWESVAEPPQLLREARDALGITEQQFGVPILGETRAFDP